MDSSLYYNPNKMLSYNRILNCVIGARGIGKSFAFKEHPIKRFLRTGEQFIYLRRYRTELKKIKNYFSDVSFKFPEHKFEVKGREFYIDKKLCGWAIPLSSWQSEKSNAYPNVSLIVYDEFIREKDNSGYLPNEVNALLNFMDTVFRNRDNVRCVCLSNAVSIVNPYFLYFNIIPNINKRFNAYESILVEIPDSEDFSIERKKTKFGQLIQGTDYGDMSLDNEFINDSTVFIEKRSPYSKYVFSVIYKGMTMGIWYDVSVGLMYLSNEHDPSSKLVYAMTSDDLNENTMLMRNWKNNYFLKKLVVAFMNGCLRFDSQVLRTTGYEMFKRMNVQ
jgi:hypothetical protein